MKLLKDLRAVLGRSVVFVGPDGWTPYSATLGAGSAAQGMYISYAGQPLETLGPKGKAFIAGLRTYAKIKGQMPPYAVYQGQSAQIMLDAIARSNGTRQLGRQAAVQDERQERHHGHVPLRQERRHRAVQVRSASIEVLKGNAGVYAYVVVTKVKT